MSVLVAVALVVGAAFALGLAISWWWLRPGATTVSDRFRRHI